MSIRATTSSDIRSQLDAQRDGVRRLARLDIEFEMAVSRRDYKKTRRIALERNGLKKLQAKRKTYLRKKLDAWSEEIDRNKKIITDATDALDGSSTHVTYADAEQATDYLVSTIDLFDELATALGNHSAKGVISRLRPKLARVKKQLDRDTSDYWKRKEKRTQRERERRERHRERHDWRGKQRVRIGPNHKSSRSLGLKDAKGIGVAMIAHIQSLSPTARAAFLATPNVVGFTDEAVRRYQEMLKGRERESRESIKRLQQLMTRMHNADSWSEGAPNPCFAPPRDAAMWSRSGTRAFGAQQRVEVPVDRQSVIGAVRAAYHAGTAQGRCATGVTGSQSFIAGRIAALALGLRDAAGWVRFPPDPGNPRRKLTIHLASTMRTLRGDMRPLAREKPSHVIPLNLEDFEDQGSGSVLTRRRTVAGAQPRRAATQGGQHR